jgi:hypothetical protein
VSCVFLVPEVRGLDFFAATARQSEVDRWWARNVPPTSVPVYLICHEVGLADWLPGVDGVAMVAASKNAADAYSAWIVVDAAAAEAPLALAEAAITRFSDPRNSLRPSLADIFDRRDARMVADLRSDHGGGASRPRFPSLVHVAGRANTAGSPPVATAEPAAVEVAGSECAERTASPAAVEPAHVKIAKTERAEGAPPPGTVERADVDVAERAPPDAEPSSSGPKRPSANQAPGARARLRLRDLLTILNRRARR